MGKRSVSICLTSVLIAVFVSACTPPNPFRRSPPTPAIPIDLPLSTQAQLRDFDLLVSTINSDYINPSIATSLSSKAATVRASISAGMSDTAFTDAITTLLADQKDSDLGIVRAAAAISASATTTTTFSGIGILAGMPTPDRNRVLVLYVYRNSPGEQAGLRPHDAITQIDGQPVSYEEGSRVLARMRGPSGSQVTLTVKTPGKEARDVVVTRRTITSQSTFESRRVSGTNIGYVSPDGTAMDGMREQVAQALRDLSDKTPLDGLVIDLRTMQNAGFPVREMLSLFVNGSVGQLQTRSTKTKIEITGKNIEGSQQLPLVILVGDQTRGVAESFAGMLQDLGRARVVGSQTPGRLAVIESMVLPNTSTVLLVPAGEYKGIKDQSWYGTGIKPDIVSDVKWEDFSSEDDPQLRQAVQSLTRQ